VVRNFAPSAAAYDYQAKWRNSEDFAPVIKATNSSPVVSAVRRWPTTRPLRIAQISLDSRIT
jgi:hypothetical protein